MDHRRIALLQWVYQNPDATGECDRCHADSVGLWSLPHELESEPDAGWMYCKRCFKEIVTRNTQVTHFKRRK